jgi:hypothetical protein
MTGLPFLHALEPVESSRVRIEPGGRKRFGRARPPGTIRVRAFGVPALLAILAAAAFGQKDGGAKARPAEMPRPWTQKVHRISLEEYEGTLDFWTRKHPDILTTESVGTAGNGMKIHLLKITERSVPDTDKQVCLISSLHGGPERSGPATVLHLAEWLLGDSPEAAETRRKQIVLLMPIVNPEAFFVTDRFGNAHGIDPYTGGGPQNWDFESMTYKALDKSPEIKAFLAVVDRYRPEVNADVHGIGLQEYADEQLGDRTMYQGQTMFEVTGSAYSNYALRPWDWRITEAMIQAGREAGYGSDRFEADAQQAFWGPAMQPIAGRFWRGRPNFYTAQYAYAKYHTLLAALEVGWEESGVARLVGLLKIGNTVWEGETNPGYPVDRVKAFIGHFVTAAGETAEQRRESRIALWQRQPAFSQAVLYPQTDGRDTYIVALTDEAGKRLDGDKEAFLAKIEGLPGFRADAVRAFFDSGPEIKLAVERAEPDGAGDGPITQGLGLRLRIPYRNPTFQDVRLNGQALNVSPVDGYQPWFADGFTQVQINIPPEKAASFDTFVVTCGYVPDVKRSYGWSPPREVSEETGGSGDGEGGKKPSQGVK